MKMSFTPIGLALALLTCLAAASAHAQPASWASYEVVFDATWSAETHPESFPGNPHFSGLIGGTHDGTVAFWAEGQLSSLGIKQMAEWGSKPTLQGEVTDAINDGHAGEVISGPVLWTSPGQVSTLFTVTPDFPLATIVSMLAPSPDWFVGVSGLSLLDGDTWVEEIIVSLYPFDAGTDSGASYTSADQATSPSEPIEAINGSPFAPGVPLGTFTFTRIAASAVEAPFLRARLSAAPNPFNPMTELSYTIPAGIRTVELTIFDARGRRVRSLPGAHSPGDHVVRWDGRTDEGRASVSGIYFALLAIDDQRLVRKLALVR